MNFTPARGRILTPVNLLMLVLVAAGLLSIFLRFYLGLGRSTNLSDTWPWGLWIAFDLIWIAVAAGAFAMAGVIYVFRREEFYEIGRSAVLVGLLSYSFVMVTLLADLGLPWHFWQLAVNVPEHSAMFEVSWCVGLYVTVLALEFAPVLFERLKWERLTALWRAWAPFYVAAAVGFFVFLISHSIVFGAVAFVVFAVLAWAVRPRPGEHYKPVMLAIGAVTFSTMHQSSLGSLFLLMPDKLSPIWWSPVMPIGFFISSIAAGISLVIIITMIVGAAYRRPVAQKTMARLGPYVAWPLLCYLGLRLVDLGMRGQLGAALGNPIFLFEAGLGGVVPLVILFAPGLRARMGLLGLGAVLALGGVILNRVSVVILGMKLHGPMPGLAPKSYVPSLVEVGVAVGLIAATVFLYNLGAKWLPVLKAPEGEESTPSP